MEHKIKVRYRVLHVNEDRVVTYIKTLKDIETGLILFNQPKSLKILSRDLWTGLVDKNSKEIFENDIVQSIDKESDIKGMVEFIDAEFRIVPCGGGAIGISCARWVVSHFELEVIGDIYNNAELINNKS